MSNGEPYPGNDERQHLNKVGEGVAVAQAEQARKNLIKFTFDVITHFAGEDRACFAQLEAQGMPEGKTVGIYILEDVIKAPSVDERIPTTLTLLLVRDLELGQEGNDKLRIFMPIVEKIDADEDEDLALPDEVYIETTDQTGIIKRYAVSHSQVYEYVSAADTGEQVILDDLHEAVWRHKVTLRVDTGLPLVAQLQEDVVNMRAVPQRLITIGTDARPLDY